MEAWEFAIANYMHETKISDSRIRRGIMTYTGTENFLYKSVAKWAAETDTQEVFCHVYELHADNNCQEFMVYTLAKAIEDIEDRLGPYDAHNWRLGALTKVRYEHSFSSTPLRSFFEEWREHSGNNRTPQMYWHLSHSELPRYTVQAGSIFRMINDMSDPDASYFSMDVEVDQSNLWSQ